MEEDLLGSIAQTKPVSLEEFIEVKPLPPMPTSTVKQNAAKVAMLSGNPASVIQDYQSIVAETESGVTYTKDRIMRSRQETITAQNREGLMSLLADPNVPMEKKQAAIKGINSEWHKEPTVIIANDGFAAPVQGESVEQEKVRLSAADLLKPYYELQQEKQKIANARQLALNPGTVVDLLTQLLPFSTNVQTTELLSKVVEEMGIKMSKGKMAFLPGSAIMDITERIKEIPVDQRIALVSRIDNIITQNHSLIVDGNNSLSAVTQMKALIMGDYSNFDKYLDNATGVLDAIGLGGLFRAGTKAVTSMFKRTKEAEVSKGITQGVIGAPSPTSVVATQAISNSDKARQSYALIVKSETDEAAQALAGTSKTDVIADAHLPQPAAVDGTVRPKVQDPEKVLRQIEPDSQLLDMALAAGAKGFSVVEMEAAKVNVLNNLKDVTGLTILDNMVSVGEKDGALVLNALYGTAEGGFLKGKEAIDHVAFALRDYGVTEDSLQLLKKVDGEYVPITLKEATEEGDYVVKLQKDYTPTAEDVGELTHYNVLRNWLDRIPSLRSNKAGTAANTILDHASMLHKELTGKAIVQSDKATAIDKRFIQLFDEFARPFTALPKEQQGRLWEHILEANRYGLELTPTQLAGKGFTNAEIEVLGKWRKSWDNMFWFENAVLAKNLAQEGYKVFSNATTQLFMKPIAKNGNIAKVYDPAIDAVRTIDRAEIDALYDAGGSLNKLRRPTDFGGEVVEHALTRNTPTEYARAINANDQVLNYRKGYFQIQYTAPKYIVKVVRDSAGRELYTKAVAVAGDSQAAKHAKDRYVTSNGLKDEDVIIRDDIKDLTANREFDWDVNHAAGRIAQKHRGKLLEGADSSVNVFDKEFVLDPLESAMRAARSLSNRIAMGDYIDITKQRAVQQYGDFFPTVNGQVRWPASSKELIATKSQSASDLADARTTVEYINYLQRGYENTLDESIKGGLKAIAETVAPYSTTAEKASRALGELGITGLTKNFVFTAYIAMAPFRQLLIQSHGLIRMMMAAPQATTLGLIDAAKYVLMTTNKDALAKASKADLEIYDFVTKSGLMDAVDKHNMVRGAIRDMSESSKPVVKTAGNIAAIPRKFGFDLGEQANQLGHVLAIRRKFMLEGKDVSKPAVQEEIHSLSRAITGDMNFAGDMPYNQNAFGALLQFAQYPHKALTAITTNRRIPAAMKFKLALGDIALFGVPGYYALERYIGEENLPQDVRVRDVLARGFEETMFNHVLSQSVDFSPLSPYSADTFTHFADALLVGGLSEMFKNSPFWSLLGPEGKAPEAVKRMGRFLGFGMEHDTFEPEDITSVLSGFAEITSGWSAAKRAWIAYEAGQLRDKKGHLIMDNYDGFNAIVNALGFRHKEELINFKMSKDSWDFKKATEEEIAQTIKDAMKIVGRQYPDGIENPEAIGAMMFLLNKTYKANPAALEIANKKLMAELRDPRQQAIRNMVEVAKFTDMKAELRSLQEAREIKDEDIQKMVTIIDGMQAELKKYKEENK